MTRPAIRSAQLETMAQILADADELKAKSSSERPGEASINEVRSASRDALEEVFNADGSVSSVERVQLPTERLREAYNL